MNRLSRTSSKIGFFLGRVCASVPGGVGASAVIFVCAIQADPRQPGLPATRRRDLCVVASHLMLGVF
ncbi:hypothetical protein E2C01_096433 [Portunus trituberculatus]|uniref:Uncharacterized protein n=1 Tax=Portunus trituberculatus TaxID=210409 RepID=A0A5B7K2Z2_PORTR|nr:hypothetical protein [Portunus trituberculatus]